MVGTVLANESLMIGIKSKKNNTLCTTSSGPLDHNKVKRKWH